MSNRIEQTILLRLEAMGPRATVELGASHDGAWVRVCIGEDRSTDFFDAHDFAKLGAELQRLARFMGTLPSGDK
jgi:hypothetical protein